MDRALLLIGILVLVMGLAGFFYGSKEIPTQGGVILRVFSHKRFKRMNVAIGAVLVLAGAAIILNAVGLA